MPKRIISRTQTGRSSGSSRRRRSSFSSRYDRDDDRDFDQESRDRRSDEESRAPRKKASSKSVIIIVIVIVGIIGAALLFGSKSTEDTKKAGPEAVTKAVIIALGTNSETSAKKYVAEGDTSINSEISTLFNKYADYFYYEDDYIKWESMTYSITAQDDTSATVAVSGTGVIVEVTYEEIWDDFDDEYVEEKVEASSEEYDFTQAIFKLKKVGEEWYLDQVPSTIF